MSCPRHDLQHLIHQIHGWFENWDIPRIFQAAPFKPTTAQPVRQVHKLAEKEAKWGAHRDGTNPWVVVKETKGCSCSRRLGSIVVLSLTTRLKARRIVSNMNALKKECRKTYTWSSTL